jgi:ribosomal protein S18 acetylase RimI-like enzyme
VTASFGVRRAAPESDANVLADVLIDCVEGGASVGFMLPLHREKAVRFWRDVFADSATGGRIVLVAEERDGAVIGTVQVVLRTPENQPHRGDITKMLVHRAARRRGAGEELMRAAEVEATRAGKTLLVLDTASSAAERLYARLGWRRVGAVPRYALGPGGGYVDTTIFYKDLISPGPDAPEA